LELKVNSIGNKTPSINMTSRPQVLGKQRVFGVYHVP
jgi:hypothetical protein